MSQSSGSPWSLSNRSNDKNDNTQSSINNKNDQRIKFKVTIIISDERNYANQKYDLYNMQLILYNTSAFNNIANVLNENDNLKYILGF